MEGLDGPCRDYIRIMQGCADSPKELDNPHVGCVHIFFKLSIDVKSTVQDGNRMTDIGISWKSTFWQRTSVVRQARNSTVFVTRMRLYKLPGWVWFRVWRNYKVFGFRV